MPSYGYDGCGPAPPDRARSGTEVPTSAACPTVRTAGPGLTLAPGRAEVIGARVTRHPDGEVRRNHPRTRPDLRRLPGRRAPSA